jgi:hypothetical protein
MPSVWVRRRLTAKGKRRFIVEYRIGGRGRPIRYGGSFGTAAEAATRKAVISGELAALRVPNLRILDPEPEHAPTLREAAEAWRAARIDVAESTKLQHRSSIRLMLDRLGPGTRVDQISAADVSAAVTELAETRKRETIRKAVNALRMTLDHAGIDPNPCDKTVRLPRQAREEINPPTAAHVHAAHALLPPRYRLPLLVLDATGMRLGELERLTWGGRRRAAGTLEGVSRSLENRTCPLGRRSPDDLSGGARPLPA